MTAAHATSPAALTTWARSEDEKESLHLFSVVVVFVFFTCQFPVTDHSLVVVVDKISQSSSILIIVN